MERSLSKEEYRASREFDMRAASATGLLIWLAYLASTPSPEELFPDEPDPIGLNVNTELNSQRGLGGWDDYQNSQSYPEASFGEDEWQYLEEYGYWIRPEDPEDSETETESTLIY